MENKAVRQRQHKGGGKMKVEAGNRKVLQDIGNVGGIQVVDGKPQINVARPMTRGYYAQLQACAKAEMEKKSVAVAADGRVEAKGKGIAAKNVAVVKKKATAKKLIVISSDEESDNATSGRRSRERSSRRKVKTLTSVLTARSQIACGTSDKRKDRIEDIDAKDVNNELAVVEYLDDLYKFYKLAEGENQLHDYMPAQPVITEDMRSIVVGWLISVHKRYELMPETLYLTINILDRYLSRKSVRKEVLQLVGLGSMLIACKYEEMWPPMVEDLVELCDYAFSESQVLVMEKAVLEKLEWYLTVPTPYVFLVRYIKASVSCDEEMENMVFFLAELGLLQYSTVILYLPSVFAAAAVYAACCTLNKTPLWSETLNHYTGYTEKELMDCAKHLARLHLAAAECKSNPNEVFQKFSDPELGAVALFPPAKSLLAKSDT